MKRLLSILFYRLLGWRAYVTVPARKKCVMCVAPHTSNWDFIYALIFDRSYGGRAHFLMKKQWFFWPLKSFLLSQGGVPVDRAHKKRLTSDLADAISKADNFHLAITPEGTRSRSRSWHHGFYYIAREAGVPIRLYVLDYANKQVICHKEVWPGDDAEQDILMIKQYYSDFASAARYPDKFAVG